ncbi:mitochondrial fission 1 protein-like isoform X2 [Dreissena polymorpha]|uniref:mitochondrial fission 1 protein-like isoform X2 n=1 Tax=Dreissena polymorpha TaxID=45954 RepID=UPI002264C548|nr:mitochondrial fission 1 protein-like isoform X2 [Dreissena polymorpha]
MDVILNDIVDANDLRKFRHQYEEQCGRGVPSEKAQFEYSICLVRSRGEQEIKHGIALLEDLFKRTHDPGTRRDCLYYLTLANTRIKNYEQALTFSDAFLKIEPMNRQVKDLQHYAKIQLRKEGLTGMAIVGGAALALGGA